MTLKPFDRKDFGARGLQQYRIAESLVIQASPNESNKVRSEAIRFLRTVPAEAQAEARAKYIA
jgi:hypothetical protein